MPQPFAQSPYQVRFEWGVAGLERLAPADVVVVVDVLRFSSTVSDAVANGSSVVLADAVGWSANGAAVVAAADALMGRSADASGKAGLVGIVRDASGETASRGTASRGAGGVLIGCLRNASAVADAVLAIQNDRQQRTSVAVIAAGERTSDGGLRFAVEDQLGAGAIISALSDRGIDHTSPEAAAACESSRGLGRALRHLVSASGSGRELADGVTVTARIEASGLVPTSVGDAAELDAITAVPVLHEGRLVAFG